MKCASKTNYSALCENLGVANVLAKKKVEN